MAELRQHAEHALNMLMETSPELTHQEYAFAAGDGLALFGQCWLPPDDRRADVVVVHGFTEHGGRYAPAAGELCRHGYGVHVMDLRGHGRSAGPRCFIRSMDQYLDDLDLFVQQVRERSDRPLFLFGHSLGGLIAVAWCITRQPRLQGLALSAPALKLQEDLFPVMRRIARFVGLVFPRLRILRMGYRSISRDPAVVEQFRNDPLVFHGRFPARTGAEIIRSMELAYASFESIRLPLLVMQGTADRVCTPAGSRALCRRAASNDKVLHLYEGLYHEILNEPERDSVLNDWIAWLDKRC